MQNHPHQIDAPANSLLPLLSVNFVGTLGFSIVIPFLVFLVTKWGGNSLIFGLLGATYSAFQFIGAPILGRWSDLYGRRKILLLSQLGTLVSWIIFLAAFFLPVTILNEIDSPFLGKFTLTVPLLVIFFARAADGLTGGNISVANAYLADISDEKNRSENFGKMALSGNLGYVLGPALAGLLGATVWGEVLPVIAALLISLAATLIIWFWLQESRTAPLNTDPEACKLRKIFGQEHKECYQLEGSQKIPVRIIFSLKDIPVLMVINFLVMLGFSFFYVIFPVNAALGLGWPIFQTGAFLAVLSLLMVIVQGPVLARASKIWSDRALALFGSLVLAGGFGLFIATDELTIYAGAVFVALGNGLMWPSILALISKRAGAQYQGTVQGFVGSSGAIASVIGLSSAGLFYNFLGSIEFLLAGLMIFCVSILMATIKA